MAPTRRSARSQPDHDGAHHDGMYSFSRPSPVDGVPLPSRFTALVLTVPGIVIYTYILYTMISKLVYPGSFSPFSNAPRPPYYEANATGGIFQCIASVIEIMLCLLCGWGYGGSSLYTSHIIKGCPPTRSTLTKSTPTELTPNRSTSHRVNCH